MNKTKITHIHNDWVDIKNECRNTINKEATDNIPGIDFKKNLLLSEHSPIRLLDIKWRWEDIKSWVSVHFARHWLGWDKWISTQRSDRTGKNRDKSPQDTLVNMDVKANAQALINVGRYRLCYQASKETREYMEDVKKSIKEIEPELSDVLVPNCIYRYGCPEFKPCGYFGKFLKYCIDNNLKINTIQQRYDAYNKMFNELKEKEDT
ncbi:FAD-dependent thymidylate synthase [Anaerocolumna aminovalerica]|uniref:FAD-dependent thymidylate synthase n=1 Tax=Anaerocolumna aminovalerica TaxID=1527 RepID=UPI001C0ED230|nr:FAD-dependent thymidylate synthase [Anaerocolumna aminovalerica]MBU5331706.1 FAD-dependent thymidylate synthase [Anaerocolumna aminovalerica]